MGQITSGVGLISGLDINAIVEQLVGIEAQPKVRLQQRNAVLTATQTAYTTVNARLLALKSSAADLAQPLNFRKTTGSTSDENVLTVSAGDGAIPGNYSLSVRQLVAAQQTLSRGFGDKDATPLGLDTTLTFERSQARLGTTSYLDDLNGGAGVQRGFIRVTDRSGTSELVDLKDAVSIDDVVTRLNSTTNVNVRAKLDGDQLVIEDATGQTTSALRITDVGVSTTATDLGLTGAAVGDTLTGASVNTIGNATALARLNDGNGIARAEGIDDLKVTTRDGLSVNLNLDNAQTVADLTRLIDEQSAGSLTLSVAPDGNSFLLTDNTAGGGNTTVEALNNSLAGEDLGMLGTSATGSIDGDRVLAGLNSKLLKNLNGGKGLVAFGGDASLPTSGDTALATLLGGAGLTTTGDANPDITFSTRDNPVSTYGLDLDGLTTVQDLIDEVDSVTAGRVAATLDGDTLTFTDTTTGLFNFTINNGVGSLAADELGITYDGTDTAVNSVDLDPAVSDTGAGITFTDSAGASATVDFAGSESVSDLINRINDAGLGLRASVNNAGSGLRIEDTANGLGSLVIADAAGSQLATQLGITGTFDPNDADPTQAVADSGSLRFGYVRAGTRLDDLGITRGKFTLTDSSGLSATVDLTQGDEVTVQDVVDEINSRGLAITARVNDTGNGLTLEDTNTDPPIVAISVEEDGSTTAADLGILGSADTIGGSLFGSTATTVEIAADDTLQDVAQKINDAGAGVAAAIFNDGSAGTPFRLSLTARDAGSDGAFAFDDGGLGLDVFNLSDARDAVVFLGSGNAGGNSVTIVSSSNTLEDTIPGVTIDLTATSDRPVQVTVSEDREAVKDTIRGFVDNFNGLMDTIGEYDVYNAEEEERGLLLGDRAVDAVRSQLYNSVFRRNSELSQELDSLTEIGIKVGPGATLQFDEAKFDAAIEADRDAVVDLFTLRQTVDANDDGEPDEDEDGEEIVTARGFGYLLNEVFDRLTDVEFGPIEAAMSRMEEQIAANEARIDTIDERLEARRLQLTNEFIAMESALADLQAQGQSLSAIAAIQPISTNNSSQG